jgi:hypothetical protein
MSDVDAQYQLLAFALFFDAAQNLDGTPVGLAFAPMPLLHCNALVSHTIPIERPTGRGQRSGCAVVSAPGRHKAELLSH